MEIANLADTFRSSFRYLPRSYEKLSRRLPGLISPPFHPNTTRSSDGEFNQQIRRTNQFVNHPYLSL